jgi:hypothetical protein
MFQKKKKNKKCRSWSSKALPFPTFLPVSWKRAETVENGRRWGNKKAKVKEQSKKKKNKTK